MTFEKNTQYRPTYVKKLAKILDSNLEIGKNKYAMRLFSLFPDARFIH